MGSFTAPIDNKRTGGEVRKLLPFISTKDILNGMCLGGDTHPTR